MEGIEHSLSPRGKKVGGGDMSPLPEQTAPMAQVNDQHNEYNRAVWHYSIVGKVLQQTNIKFHETEVSYCQLFCLILNPAV